MRALWRDQSKIVTFLLLLIFVVFYVFSDDKPRSDSHFNTLSLDLETEGHVRLKTGRLKMNKHEEEHHIENYVVTRKVEEKETRKQKHDEDKPLLTLDNFIDWEMKNIIKKAEAHPAEYLDYFKNINNPKIQPPEDIVHTEGFIDVGFTLINLQRTANFGRRFRFKVDRTLSSLMAYSSDTPLHFIVVTDPASLASVGSYLAHFISRSLSEGVIWNGGRSKIRLPKLRFSFVDMEDIRKLDEPFVNALKRNTEAKDGETVDKYAADLFYIAPLYFKAFRSLDRMIFLDITDLDFFDSIRHLQKQFDKIDQEWMAVGVETTPHYRKFLAKYLEDRAKYFH